MSRVRAPAAGSPRRLLTSDLRPPRPCGPLGRLARPGDHSAREPPDPIPNSAVKPCCAQGTALRRVGERVVARPGEAPERPAGPQRSEVRCQRSGHKRSEVRSQEVRAQRACPLSIEPRLRGSTRQHQPPPALPGSPAPPPADRPEIKGRRSETESAARRLPPRRTNSLPKRSDLCADARAQALRLLTLGSRPESKLSDI